MVWIVLALGILSAGALAIFGVMNGGFRPDAEWHRLAAELRARNEPLVFSEVVPPEVPAERNVFAAPVFGSLGSSAPPSDLLERTARPLAGRNAGEWLAATAQPDGSARLDPIADAMAAENLLDADYLLPADRIVAGMQALGISFQPLADAARRPDARFPVDYTTVLPALPHLDPLESLGNWLAIDALARIATGNGAAATADILLIGRLAGALAAEPFLASQRVRRNLLTLAAGCIRAGIDVGAFDEEALASLAAALEPARPIEDFARAVRGERAALNTILDGEIGDSSQGAARICEAWLGAAPASLSARDLRARRILANAAAQDFLDQLGDPAGIVPAALLPPAGSPAPPRLDALAAEAGAFAQVQTYLAQAVVACALERHRLVHGGYPAGLDALAPQFLPAIPLDPMTGIPPAYENGGSGFTLTGAGWGGGPAWIWKG